MCVCASVCVHVRVCTLILFAGEECVKGRRMGVAGVRTKFCSHKFECVLCSLLGKGKCVQPRSIGLEMFYVCVCF